jgi:hypothetical protein
MQSHVKGLEEPPVEGCVCVCVCVGGGEREREWGMPIIEYAFNKYVLLNKW